MSDSSPVETSQVNALGIEALRGHGSNSDTANMEIASQPARSLSLPRTDSPVPALEHIPPQPPQVFQGSATRHKAKSRASLPQHPHRRSLADLEDLSMSSFLRDLRFEDLSFSDSGFDSEDLPSTPRAAQPHLGLDQEVARSAERQQYRSWREGKAKINGMSIADSQRRKTRLELGVDKIIDAQLPKPEPSVTNVRSRKTSHYLGLFKDHQAEERSHDGRGKSGLSKDAVRLDKIEESTLRSTTDTQDNGTRTGKKAVFEAQEAVVSTSQIEHNLPLDLLEEIRNHHHLVPGAAPKDAYHKIVPAKDSEHTAT